MDDNEDERQYDLSKFVDNPVAFVNEHFVDEYSISGIETLIDDVNAEIRKQDGKLMDIINEKATTGQVAYERFEKLQCATNDLIKKMSDIQTPTLRSEQSLKILTADIRALNRAKTNICNTIVNLKRLHMLSTMLESLGEKAKHRKYNEAAGLTVVVRELCQLVQPLREAPPVVKLLTSCTSLMNDLKQQLTEDLEIMLSLNTSQGYLDIPLELEDVCKCADAVDDGIRKHIASKYAKYITQSYESMFPTSFDLKSLDNINERFAWLRRTINDFDELYGSGVPEHWHIQASGAWAFFESCRGQIVSMLTSSNDQFDPNVILISLLRCKEFEQEIDYRLVNYSDEAAPLERQSVEFPEVIPSPKNRTTSAAPHKSLKGVLSRCFENFLGPWIANEEMQLTQLYDKIISSSEDDVIMHVLRSAKELFTAISALSSEQTLFEMSSVFERIIQKYQLYLQDRLDKLDKTLAFPIIANKSGYIIATCDYCIESLEHLHDEVVETIAPAYRELMKFVAEKEKFIVTKSDAVKRFLDESCKFAPIKASSASPLKDLQERVMEAINLAVEHLPPCYLHYVTNKVTRGAMSHLKNAIFSLGCVTEGYCQQLLLDSYSLHKLLTEGVHEVVDPLPLGYMDAVASDVDKIQTLIKILNSPERDAEAFEPLLLDNGGNCTREELDQILAIQRKG
ncbi:Vps53-like family protein [Babesia divergens]|uniref:Vps53-like family protein n=1 Tax=Babesia divergens TaxID=32595 RepID=A0AAD9GEX7_BABDI|nr:Vps53-like family protein [Babesia divergens]